MTVRRLDLWEVAHPRLFWSKEIVVIIHTQPYAISNNIFQKIKSICAFYSIFATPPPVILKFASAVRIGVIGIGDFGL